MCVGAPMKFLSLPLGLALVATTTSFRFATAQTFPTDDPTIRRIWVEGMDSSQVYPLAQVLLDSIGPRLTGSPQHGAAVEWALSTYKRWGIVARREQYGTWIRWERGITHVDLLTPRIRTLEGTMLAWSPGTDGPVEGDVVILPEVSGARDFEAWLPKAQGNFVLISPPEPTCRPDQRWEELATPTTLERMRQERERAREMWLDRIRHIGRGYVRRLEQSGAAGVLSSRWSRGWGVNKVFDAPTDEIPALDLSCEDYGLVYRLAENGQLPRIRLDAEAEFHGEGPVYNVIAEIRGSEKPDEYVVLSAHIDSWDGASGATDNGTGTVTMMEAMRILKEVYPNPKRTIVVGHWGGEEQGLIGSRAFVEDHREILDGLQAAFNQDNGTWRVEYIKMQGLSGAGGHFGRWFGHIPVEIKQHITLDIPGTPEFAGSDHMSFLCHGAPGFRLQSSYPEYRQYTWHTNRDTFDKLVFDDLKNNATLTAMLAYLASEDPEMMPRDRRVLPVDSRTAQPMRWPECRPARRSWGR
jgi:hypothetical protein